LLEKFTTALVAFGPFGILLLAGLDSVVSLPAALDFLLVAYAVKDPQNAYFAALMAVVGSTAGNIALFLGAQHGSKWYRKGRPSSTRGQKFQQWFQRYGLLTVFVPAVTPVVPFPLKVFVISAGALRTRFGKFLLVVLLARAIRYFGEAYLGVELGEHAKAFLLRNAWSLLGAALAVATGIYLLIRFRVRRGEPVL
jgi:membrane protein YqaA with SNARE-associated domain